MVESNLKQAEEAIERATTAEDINLAATLRDIAASCDETTGRVLRLCTKAANNGKAFLIVKVNPEDREYLYTREQAKTGYSQSQYYLTKLKITPLIERLESLSFKLESTDNLSSWGQERCFIRISW